MIVARDIPQSLLDLLNIVDYGAIPAATMTIILTGLNQFTRHLPTKPDGATSVQSPSSKLVAADMPQKILNVFNRINYGRVPESEYNTLYERLRVFIASGNVPVKAGAVA